MKSKQSGSNTPFSFELGADTAKTLLSLVNSHDGLSNTTLVEYAITRFDYDKLEPKEEGRRQFSIRLPAEVKAQLEQVSAEKKISVGQLIRLAVEDLTTKSPKKIAKELNNLSGGKSTESEPKATKKKKGGKKKA
ncbi:MAG: ribbon-helix-helix domain-containing protein [Verrucomicrobia bacterium]|nr:ribbon-helix-helix domain-containing protein [Verrucomicrobiota bacterium]